MRKILAIVAVALLALATVGAAVAAAAPVEPAKAYGVCVHKSTGVPRVLERNNLAKSVHGKCKSSERRITLPSVTGLSPAKLVFRRAAETETCTRVSATASTWTFSCASVAIPSPSPSATPSATPSS